MRTLRLAALSTAIWWAVLLPRAGDMAAKVDVEWWELFQGSEAIAV